MYVASYARLTVALTCIHVYIYMYMSVCCYISICKSMCILLSIFMYISIYIYLFIYCVHMCVNIMHEWHMSWMHDIYLFAMLHTTSVITCRHTYMYPCIYIHVCIHTQQIVAVHSPRISSKHVFTTLFGYCSHSVRALHVG